MGLISIVCFFPSSIQVVLHRKWGGILEPAADTVCPKVPFWLIPKCSEFLVENRSWLLSTSLRRNGEKVTLNLFFAPSSSAGSMSSLSPALWPVLQSTVSLANRAPDGCTKVPLPMLYGRAVKLMSLFIVRWHINSLCSIMLMCNESTTDIGYYSRC